MALSDADLAWIRDRIGTTQPPTDDDLDDYYTELGDKAAVALRVLRRRKANLAAEPASVNIDGVLSISQVENLKQLSTQIGSLEAEAAASAGAAVTTTTVLTRTDQGR